MPSLRTKIDCNGHRPRFLFFSGKGGVGKTTMSSATAVWLARRGYRVLQVSTDLQKSLNDIYEQAIENTPTAVHDVPNLRAVNIETAESMERHRGKIMHTLAILDPESPMLKQMKDDRMTDCGCAQAAVFELTEYLNTTDHDVVVFDTAPAGSTLEKIETQSRSILTLVRQIEIKQKLRDVFGDDGLASQIAALEEIRARDERAFEVLRSGQTAFTMILIPEALPFAELRRNIEDLEGRYRIPVEGVVINNVLPEAERDGTAFWREHWSMQERYIGLVHERFADRAIAEVSMLPGETVGLPSLTRVAGLLYGGDA